jgi:hypothetical protein
MLSGFKHQQSAIPTIHNVLRQPFPAVFAHILQVRQNQTCSVPFTKGQLCRADFDAVIVVGSAIRQYGTFGRVDLAGVAIMAVHGLSPLAMISVTGQIASVRSKSDTQRRRK